MRAFSRFFFPSTQEKGRSKWHAWLKYFQQLQAFEMVSFVRFS
jgi:hypothetical protein